MLLFWKKNFWQNHENSCWILAPFLSEAAEASLCYFLENWLMKLKCPNLRNTQICMYLHFDPKVVLDGLRGLQSMSNPVETPLTTINKNKLEYLVEETHITRSTWIFTKVKETMSTKSVLNWNKYNLPQFDNFLGIIHI